MSSIQVRKTEYRPRFHSFVLVLVKTSTVTPQTSLNDYLRKNLHLTGTKSMCYEGGCGACIVAVRIKDPTSGNYRVHAVNSVSATVILPTSINLVSKVFSIHIILSRMENLHHRGHRQLQNRVSSSTESAS